MLTNKMFLSENDIETVQRFSFAKAIMEAGEGKLTGVEREMHREGVKHAAAAGQRPEGNLSIPWAVLKHQRDLTAGTDNQGGYSISTDLHPASFVELLQNKCLCLSMGATHLDNLVGNVAIPTQATGATATWEGENDANAESSPTFGQLALSPNRVGTYTEVSKQLLVQSSLGVDNIIRNLLVDSIALAVDYAALHGSGSGNQPLGIAGTSGIGSVVGGADGLAPTWAHIVELETDVASANGDIGTMGYITNPLVRGELKNTMRTVTYGDIPIWDVALPKLPLNGHPVGVTNQVSSTLTKGSSSGVCSAIFFGCWADLVVAQWGGLDLVIDPFSLATTNQTRITANGFFDCGLKHAASFSCMLDALTA